MDRDWLRTKARQAIQSGKLPDRPPDRSWGGPGSGGDCTVCGKSLIPDESELELDFGQDSVRPSRLIYHVHFRCFDAWELELPNAKNGKRRSSIDGDSLPPAENGGTMTDREHTGINERERE